MNIEERFENMEKEVGRLKRRNRWLLGAILLVAGGLVVPAVFETTASRARAQGVGTVKQIRARSLIIEDENGKSRLGLAVSKDGPGLIMFDENVRMRVVLGISKEGPGLWLYGEKGKSCVTLAALKESLGLGLEDENGQDRAGLAVDKDGPGLVLLDEKGKVIWNAIK